MLSDICRRIGIKYKAELECDRIGDNPLKPTHRHPIMTINPYNKVSEGVEKMTDDEKFSSFESIFQEYLDSLDHTFDIDEYMRTDIKFITGFDTDTIYSDQTKSKVRYTQFIFGVFSYDDSLLPKVKDDLNKLTVRVEKIMTSLNILKYYSDVKVYPAQFTVESEDRTYYNGYKLVAVVESNI